MLNDKTVRGTNFTCVHAGPQEGWTVLGIGLNVAVRVDELPAELKPVIRLISGD